MTRMLNLKPSLSIRCDNELLGQHVSWGDLEYAYSWPGGCSDASWQITRRSNQRPPNVHLGSQVDITWGGWPIYTGTLDAPAWNGREAQLKARGAFRLGEAFMAFDGSGNTTDNPTIAIDAAQDRGLPWLIGSGVPNDSLVDGTTEPVNSILDLMEAFAERDGTRWGVDGDRYVRMAADPTTPYYRIPAGIVDLGESAEGYRSRIVLRYQKTDESFDTVWWPGLGIPAVADYTAVERKKQYVEWVRDATFLGPIADTTANTLAAQIYDMTGGKPGWANGVTVAYGQLLTVQGQAPHPASVRAGRMVRLDGVPDSLTGFNYTDFIIGETAYTHGAKSVTLNPVGMTVTTPEDAWAALFEKGD